MGHYGIGVFISRDGTAAQGSLGLDPCWEGTGEEQYGCKASALPGHWPWRVTGCDCSQRDQGVGAGGGDTPLLPPHLPFHLPAPFPCAQDRWGKRYGCPHSDMGKPRAFPLGLWGTRTKQGMSSLWGCQGTWVLMEGQLGVLAVGPALLGCWGRGVPLGALGDHVGGCWQCPWPSARVTAGGELPPHKLLTSHCDGKQDGGSCHGSSVLSPPLHCCQESESPPKYPKVPS